MRFIFLLLLPLISALSTEVEEHEENIIVAEENKKSPKPFAVLVAGSEGWLNYRHQADICHAYKILVKRGIPKSNIIVLMKDDIANNTLNPTPGVVINKPNGTNVYEGIKIDYKGSAVTPEVFRKVLLGNQEGLKEIGSGRVLRSGPKDNVLIYFAGHGGMGFLCFPDKDLSAKDFIYLLEELTNKKKFDQLVLHIDAPESGSIFNNLLPWKNKILASAAAAFDETAYGFYCNHDIYPCLGDLYSVNWLEHLSKKLPSNENLFDQYQLIRTLTPVSHPYLYGDYRVGKASIHKFVGSHNFVQTVDNRRVSGWRGKVKKASVSSHNVPIQWMRRMLLKSKKSSDKLKFKKMIAQTKKKQKLINNLIEEIIEKAAAGDEYLQSKIELKHRTLNANMLTCYEDLYRLFSKKCVDMFKNPFTLKHFYKFANICLRALKKGEPIHERAVAGINSICTSDFRKKFENL